MANGIEQIEKALYGSGQQKSEATKTAQDELKKLGDEAKAAAQGFAPPEAGQGAPGSQGPAKITLENVNSLDVSKLRLLTNIDLYLEDPVAYITNRVWNYDVNKPSNIVFGYKLPSEIDVNSQTKNFINGILLFDAKVSNAKKDLIAAKLAAKKEPNKAKPLQPFRLQFDSVFYDSFGLAVKTFLKNQFPQSDLNFLQFEKNLENVFISENMRFFWFWVNQIFAANVELKPNNRFDFVVNEDSCVALNFAAYFLSQKGTNKDFGIDYFSEYIELLDTLKSVKNTSFPFKFSPAKLVENKTFVNKNNYFKQNKTVVENTLAVNYSDSPFFTYNKDNFNKEEKANLPTPKQIKNCKDDKFNKGETGLRLFYKEGNDNILDKDVPPAGLGCATQTLAWTAAQNILFDGDSLDTVKQRVNLTLPYYNVLRVLFSKNNIPEKLNIYDFIISEAEKKRGGALGTKDYNIYKGFNSLWTKSELIKKSDLLTDNNLVKLEEGVAANLLFSQYSKADPSWGPRKFLQTLPKNDQDKLLFSDEPALYPFLGLYNVALSIDKNTINGKTLQRFWINPIVFLPNSQEGFDNLFRVYDSQIKYAKQYSYALRQFIFANEIEYKYLAIPGFSINEGTKGTRYSYEPVFKGIKNVGKVEQKDLNKVDAGLSFVDLPPNEIFLEVFPRRGINNKIVFLFNKYSSSGKVQEEIIPKQFWSDGWEESKKYYLKNINQVSTDEDQVFFADQPIRKVKLYGSKEKPKNKYALKNLISEIDVFSEGFNKTLDIEPNVKYYFSATAVSATGLESPPSQVYSVEVVDDGGAVFPIIQVLKFSEKQKRKDKLHFTSKFRIEPSLLQQAPNPPKDGIGYLNPSVFSLNDETRPQFKVRLTSKKTGRKADFNIIYKQNFATNANNQGPLNLDVVTKDKVLISYSSSDTFAGKEATSIQKQIDKLQVLIIGNVDFGADPSKVLPIQVLKKEIIPAFEEIITLGVALGLGQTQITLDNGLTLSSKEEIQKRINELYEFIAVSFNAVNTTTNEELAEKNNLWFLTNERKNNILSSLGKINSLIKNLEKTGA